MEFVIGDRKEGYSISYAPKSRPKYPWVSSVWDDGRVRRHDYHETKREAINYCHSRYRGHRETGLKVHLRSRRAR